MEPVTTTIAAIIAQVKMWSSIFGKWKKDHKAKLAGMALSDVRLIDRYVAEGRIDELYDAYKDKSGWPQTKAREYLNLIIDAIMEQNPRALLTAEAMSWDAFRGKMSMQTGIPESEIIIPNVGSGSTIETTKTEKVSAVAKQIEESPLSLLQKYWYAIPIILIPVFLFKGNPCRFK